MDGGISTSISSVRTVYQNRSQHFNETTGGSQNQRDSERDHVPNASHVANEEGTSGLNQDTDCLHCSGTSSRYSGVLVSTPSSPRMHALVLPSPPDSPGGSPSPSVDSASESSLPSVSSSFFFSSSAANSPGRSHPGSYPSSYPHSDHEHDQDQDHEYDHHNRHQRRVHDQGLIIPSLTLPEALRRPTPFGQTLGDIRILVLGAQGAGKSFLTGLLLEDNEDVVDVGTWEDWNSGETGIDVYGKVLRASTDWMEQHDTFGLERFEPTKNVEIVELPGYSHDTNGIELISRLKSIIEGPFRSLHDVLHPDTEPSGVIAGLLAAPTSPLYTALIFLLPPTPTSLDSEIIHALSNHIPIIVLPQAQSSWRNTHAGISSLPIPSAKLSAFRPATPVALRNGLFHSPETASLLRSEAADRFMRWREVENAVEGIWQSSMGLKYAGGTLKGNAARTAARQLGERAWGLEGLRGRMGVEETTTQVKAEVWSKAKWEAEWMEDHAQEVAKRMREETSRKRMGRSRTGTMLPPLQKHSSNAAGTTVADGPRIVGQDTSAQSKIHGYVHEPYSTPFDPLHLPSLLVFSASLLGPLRVCIAESVRSVVESLNETKVQVALFGGFCFGMSVGMWVRSC